MTKNCHTSDCETPIFSESLLDVDESDDYDSDTDSENDDAV
jgi:hypothetical protein